MKRKILILCMTALLIIICMNSVYADGFDSEKTGSITVKLTDQNDKTSIVGAELSLYHIADVGINNNEKLNYFYRDSFKEVGVNLDDPELVDKLDVYLSQNEVIAEKLLTDANGTAVYSDLPLGLYFIRQTNVVEGFAACAPFLVTVPMEFDGNYVYDVNASPKTEVEKLTSITIKKIWNTSASAKAADSVAVQLLRSGNVVETAILNEDNNWQMTYTDMPESDAYSIKEINIPKGFTATYQQSQYEFTVTNTSTLIKTGQLIWPIPFLAFAGIVLICIGCMLLQKKRNKDA